MIKSNISYTEEKNNWDNFLLSYNNYHIFQSYSWLNLKSTHKFPDKWKIIFLKIYEDKRIIASCGILKWKIPFLPFSILWAPRGPNILEYYNDEVLRLFYTEITKLAKLNNSVFFICSPYLEKNSEERKILEKNNFNFLDFNFPTITMPTPIMVLNIEDSLEDIFKAMDKDTRYMIRKSEKQNINVRESRDLNELKIFHQWLKNSGRKKGFPVRSYYNLKHIWDILKSNDNIHLFLAEKRGKLLSGSVILNFGKKCWWLYGASIHPLEKNIYPNHLLQFEIIKWAKANNMTIYDLRGAMGYNHPPDSPAYGVYHFKKGFGAQVIHLVGEMGIVFKPKLYNILKYFNSFYLPYMKKMFTKIY